jgi:hypothetical protein
MNNKNLFIKHTRYVFRPYTIWSHQKSIENIVCIGYWTDYYNGSIVDSLFLYNLFRQGMK